MRDARWNVAGGVKGIHNDETLQVVRFQWRNFCSMEMRLGALKRKAEREMGLVDDNPEIQKPGCKTSLVA